MEWTARDPCVAAGWRAGREGSEGDTWRALELSQLGTWQAHGGKENGLLLGLSDSGPFLLGFGLYLFRLLAFKNAIFFLFLYQSQYFSSSFFLNFFNTKIHN